MSGRELQMGSSGGGRNGLPGDILAPALGRPADYVALKMAVQEHSSYGKNATDSRLLISTHTRFGLRPDAQGALLAH